MTGKLVLLIPAYKPSPRLAEVMADVASLDDSALFKEIIVVDDGSGGEFDQLFAFLRSAYDAKIIRHAVNLGKGAALKTGFNYALVQNPEILGVVTADADGQHSSVDILKVAHTSLNHPEVLVIGARSFDKRVPLRSLVGNVLTRWVFRALAGICLADTQSGLRAWPRELCLQALRINANGYEFETESLLKLREYRSDSHPLLEVPIQTIYDAGNKTSHFSPIVDSMRIYFVFLRYMGAALCASFIDYVIFYCMYLLTETVSYSLLAGRSIAVLVAYRLVKKIAFRNRSAWFTTLPLYLLLVAGHAAISYMCITYLHTRYSVAVLPAKIITESTLFFASFSVQRMVFQGDSLS